MDNCKHESRGSGIGKIVFKGVNSVEEIQEKDIPKSKSYPHSINFKMSVCFVLKLCYGVAHLIWFSKVVQSRMSLQYHSHSLSRIALQICIECCIDLMRL